METVRVDLAERRYDILIGDGLLRDGELLADGVVQDRAVLITNETVAQWYAKTVQHTLEAKGIRVEVVTLPDGEVYKTLDIVSGIWDVLLQKRYGRDVTLYALGGGVVGDMVGFAAALYQRGVRFVQIPTTLLAQVDSSVGGKTGVNHPLGKNMIGAFHQPQRVIVDTSVLKTLSRREISAGLAEVVKYGLIWDEAFFSELESRLVSVSAFTQDWAAHIIRRSCEIKAAVVEMDECESGVRAILNLGHTFGHALEACLGYGVWLHGEAVGLGMLMAAQLSADMGLLDKGSVERCRQINENILLPTEYPATVSPEQLLLAMGSDKKVLGGQLRLVLLEAIGKARISSQASESQILSVLTHFQSKKS